MSVSPTFGATYWMLIAASAHLGRDAEARRHLRRFRQLFPGATAMSIETGAPRADRMEAIGEGLRLAGLD